MSDTFAVQLVDDDAGGRVSFGDIQIAWLVERGAVELVESVTTSPLTKVNLHRARAGLTAAELAELVQAQPQLRECDFCRQLSAPWRIRCSLFDITTGEFPGRFTRDGFACDACAELVRHRQKSQLISRAIRCTVQHALDRGGSIAAHTQSLTPTQVRRGLEPMVREIVNGIVGGQRGFPFRDTGESEAA